MATKKELLLSIGQVANLLGLSITTLRRMDESGELKPACVTEGNHRRYTTDQIEEARQKLGKGPRQIQANCVKMSDFRDAVIRLCDKVGADQDVNITFNQHVGYPSVAMFVTSRGAFYTESVPVKMDCLLDDSIHEFWGKDAL